MSLEGNLVDHAKEASDLELRIRAQIAELDPGVGYTEPQIVGIIEVVKKIIDTR